MAPAKGTRALRREKIEEFKDGKNEQGGEIKQEERERKTKTKGPSAAGI